MAGNPTASTVTVPSVTPQLANERLVVLHGAANNATAATWSPPAAMTEQVQNPNQNLRAVGFADRALASPAPTGALTSTLSTTANLSAIAFLLRPAPAARTIVFRRKVQAGDTQITLSPSPLAEMAVNVAAYRGVDPTNPIDALTTGGATATTTLNFGSLTAGTTGERLVVAQGATNTTTSAAWSPPSGATERSQVASSTGSSGLADRALSSSGATGPFATTVSTPQPTQWTNVAGAALTLRPAAPTYAHDGNGNLASSSDGAALSYDTADRTTSITPATGTATTFTYRGTTQNERSTMSPAARVSSACVLVAGCRPAATTTLGATATFQHSQLGISAETIDGVTTYYVRDPRGGLLAERTAAGSYFYLLDGHNSVVGLTDASGNVAATYGYDPYGQLTSMSGGTTATNNPWRYTSAYQDATGLYKLGARYYDPTLGRFTQQDPIHNPFDPKQWNRYTYAGADPINFSDNSGLNAVSDFFSKCREGVRKTWGALLGIFAFYGTYEAASTIMTREVARLTGVSVATLVAEEAGVVTGGVILGGLAIAAAVGVSCYKGHR